MPGVRLDVRLYMGDDHVLQFLKRTNSAMTVASPRFEWAPDWEPELRATLLFVVKDERILLIRKKRGIGAGKVNGPGGKFEPGETALSCALREVREELGIEVTDARERGVLNFSFRCGTTPEIRCHVFLASAFEGTPVETDEADPFWAEVGAIPYGRMWEDDRYWLPALLEGKTFEAFFTFEGDRLLEYSLKTGGAA